MILALAVILYFSILLAYLLHTYLGLTWLAYIIGVGSYIVAFALFLYYLVLIFRDLITGLQINPLYLLFLPAPFMAYAVLKKITVGVFAEAMGAKGLLPAIVRIGSILLGQGEPLQVLGVWVGMLMMVFGFYVALLTAAQYKGTFTDRLFLFLGAFGIVVGFVTAHLAQTGYMYPFTIMIGTMYVSFYIPLYYVGLLVGMLLLPIYFRYLLSR